MKLGRIAGSVAAGLLTVSAGLLALTPTASASTALTAQPAVPHVATVDPGLTTPPLPAAPHARLTAGRSICYAAHVQNIGWQGWVCDGAVAGTTGQSLRMEALAIVTYGTGGICAEAHVQNIGWQGWRCQNDGTVVVVGTTGQSLRMEALALSPGHGNACADAHVQNIGWQGWRCGSYIVVGTTGQSLRMEAVEITV